VRRGVFCARPPSTLSRPGASPEGHCFRPRHGFSLGPARLLHFATLNLFAGWFRALTPLGAAKVRRLRTRARYSHEMVIRYCRARYTLDRLSPCDPLSRPVAQHARDIPTLCVSWLDSPRCLGSHVGRWCGQHATLALTARQSAPDIRETYLIRSEKTSNLPNMGRSHERSWDTCGKDHHVAQRQSGSVRRAGGGGKRSIGCHFRAVRESSGRTLGRSQGVSRRRNHPAKRFRVAKCTGVPGRG